MRSELLPYLACPDDGSSLEVEGSHGSGEEILVGHLSCVACSRSWPISGGIPRFVDENAAEKAVATGAAFAREWTDFSEVAAHHRQQFLDWLAPLEPGDFAGKVVLEGGCGKGRHSAAAHDFGASEVVSIDIGSSVDVARRNNISRLHCHFVQADLGCLPLKPLFDLVFSVGVLHHLEDPLSGAREMIRKLKPGGTAAFWVYGRENNGWILRFVNPIRERLTSRLPHGLLKALSAAAAVPLWSAVKTLYRFREMRFLPYWAYLHSISRLPFREIHSIVYDHLVAPTAHYLTRLESEALIVEPGLKLKVTRHHNRQSWTVVGRNDNPSALSFVSHGDDPGTR